MGGTLVLVVGVAVVFFLRHFFLSIKNENRFGLHAPVGNLTYTWLITAKPHRSPNYAYKPFLTQFCFFVGVSKVPVKEHLLFCTVQTGKSQHGIDLPTAAALICSESESATTTQQLSCSCCGTGTCGWKPCSKPCVSNPASESQSILRHMGAV